MNKLYIGIDGGRDTGLACWNSAQKKYMEIKTTDFWGAIERIEYWNQYCLLNACELYIIIENPAGNSPVFKLESVYGSTNGTHHAKLSACAFVASSVGSVKRESELIIEYCNIHKITYRAVIPGKRSLTKMDAKKFEQYTGVSSRTSQHGRDAAMLVFQM